MPGTCWHPRLSADGLDDLVLSLDNGWRLEYLDIGSPVVAEVIQGRPDADGALDGSMFHRERAVTMQLWLVPMDGVVRRSMLDQLKRFLHPRIRPYVIFAEDSTDPTERRVRLRASQWADPLISSAFRSVLVSWVAPDGIIEANTDEQAISYASGSGTELGLTFDALTFDAVTFPATPIIGSTVATNSGTTDAYPLIRIYGDCTEPVIQNMTTGKALEFTGLTINAGEFLEIDTRAKTIRYQGLASDSRYDKLDFSASSWWVLKPGDNLLRFNPATSGTVSQAQITWRSAWL